MSAEHGRLIGNMLMLGVVTDLDEADARVRVDVDGMLTDWIPWCERRAGPGVRTWSAPEVGEQVLVASPYGDPAQGVVIGSVFQDAYPAPAQVKTTHVTKYADGTVVEYDSQAKAITVNVGSGKVIVNCASAEVHATDSVTLDTPSTHATGDLKVDGKVSAGGDITSGGEVSAGSIGLKAHHHTAQGATSPTTPSQA